MPLLIHDETISEALIAERRKAGQDRYDEVWNGIYVMSPIADNAHQDLVMAFSGALMMAWDLKGLGRTQPGANVSNDQNDWRNNYRIPDVLCFTTECPAQDRGSHWFGGPEFAIEITSPGDRTLEKLDFYTGVGTKELLVVDRNPWRLTMYRTAGETMQPIAGSDADDGWIESSIVPVRFQLDRSDSKIRIVGADGQPLREVSLQI